ncbi:MAG: pantetheine-phosphate adenylyltransferase [Planctomycetota bacterium]
MSTPHALFPGTFDPPTLGHIDVLGRARRIFARVTVLLAEHPGKNDALLSLEERVRLLERCTAEMDGVAVRHWGGLVVDACGELGASAIVRGLRSGEDFSYEAQMAGTNRVLRPGVETVFLPTSPAFSHISSTLVRQIVRMGGDPSALVPPAVAAALRARPAR